jgi:hypothetical protein
VQASRTAIIREDLALLFGRCGVVKWSRVHLLGPHAASSVSALHRAPPLLDYGLGLIGRPCSIHTARAGLNAFLAFGTTISKIVDP